MADGENGEEKDCLSYARRGETMVHEVKLEVGSRDEVRHTEKSDRWFSEKWWCMDEQV